MPGAQPLFLYDLASPDCYLAMERVVEALGTVPELVPVRLVDVPGAGALDAFRCAEEETIWRADVERRAVAQGVPALRWPDPWPPDTGFATRVATYAKGIGKVAAFSLAAFRQAFAGGRDLSDPNVVLIAAAACEMHPRAVLAAAELRGTAEAVERAHARAAALGVRSVPAVAVGEDVFEGPDALERAAPALAAVAP